MDGTAAGAPDWVKDGVEKTREELALFFATAIGITLRPATFAREWSEGRRRALNPLGFLATSIAIVGPAKHVGQLLMGVAEPGGLRNELWQAAVPYFEYVVLGVIAHFVLRAFGSRAALRSTVGVCLYAGGGPSAAVTLLVLPVGVAAKRLLPGNLDTVVDASQLTRSELWLASLAGVVSLGAFAVYVAVFARALSGVHGKRWYASLTALAVGGLAMALTVGTVRKLAGVQEPEVASGGIHFELSASSRADAGPPKARASPR